ncbi:pyridoxal phosphate-dependent aminotransferase [Dolosicoccus paucivorans]|nr:histidinol-phosphate transaminase [Dolosicoccus paucivorans]SDI56889.1 histidinol-phosphate aminotransferase [Dolosicoccus paucivorans]
MTRLFKKGYGQRPYSYLNFETAQEMNERLGIDTALRLSLNENAYTPSPHTKDVLANLELSDLTAYPSSPNKALRKALAKHYQVPEEAFVITNGLEEMILMFTESLIDTGDEVIVHFPTFPEYKVYAEQLGAVVREVDNFHPGEKMNWQGLLEAINDQTKLIYICNPNNPTGEWVTRQEIESFLKQVPSHVTVVVDEAYMEFAENNEEITAIPLMEQFSNLSVWRTFSKAYGLAFARIGYGLFSPEYAEGLSRVRPAFSVNGISELVALAALEDQDHLQKISAKNASERRKWLDLLEELNLTHFDSATNFVMFEYDKAEELVNYLANKGYQVNTHTYPTWIRLTLPKEEAGETVRQMVRDFVTQ